MLARAHLLGVSPAGVLAPSQAAARRRDVHRPVNARRPAAAAPGTRRATVVRAGCPRGDHRTHHGVPARSFDGSPGSHATAAVGGSGVEEGRTTRTGGVRFYGRAARQHRGGVRFRRAAIAPVERDAASASDDHTMGVTKSWEEVEEDKVAEALAEVTDVSQNVLKRAMMDMDEPAVDRESAAAIKAKLATYDSLKDIVLDFDPSISVAEKLLLIGAYFQTSPTEVATRLAEVTAVAARLYAVWTWEGKVGVPMEKRTRSAQLRDGVASLGPVFVKIAQTLSTRPDVIGQEAADALTVLQDQMTPFPSDDAYRNIREEFKYDGPICPGDPTWKGDDVRPMYKSLSPKPVAAASIGQVYKGELWDDEGEVAVKVQRPGVLRQIALDLHISRLGLEWLEESGLNGAEDLPNIVDRVGSGIFQELDYRVEAQNADDFRRSLRFLDFLFVPRNFPSMTGQRVLTQQWINGRPLKMLNDEEQLRMVQMGVECSSAQLFRTGLVHADPHEGNMLYTDDGKLALIDFGLVCRVNNAQQEAMAGCILNVLNRDWMDLIDNLRIIEMLPEVPQRWVNANNGERTDYTERVEGKWVDCDDPSFREAFRKCLDGDDPEKKLTNFTELVVDLTKLSTGWRFNLPPYMVFIIRSLTTLDFCAVRTGANMYELAAPTALFRAMAPKTARGKAQLEKMMLAADGNINWEKLLSLAESAGGDVGGKSKAGAENANVTEEGADGVEAAATAPAPGKMDKHVQESVNRLVRELVGSSSGNALRRIFTTARPESLVPPAAVRAMLVRAARNSFAKSFASLSPRQLASLVFDAVKATFSAIFSGKPKGSASSYFDDDVCAVFEEGSPEKLNCRVNLDKRRKEIARLMIKSKLSGPKGWITAITLAALVGWAAVTGAAIGITQGIRHRLIKALGGVPAESLIS